MKVDYYNRYGDIIVFEKLDDNTIKMSGFEYSRSGYNADNETIEFIDPSGGPYIAVGMNLSNYFNTKEDMTIKAIEFDPEHGTVLTI